LVLPLDEVIGYAGLVGTGRGTTDPDQWLTYRFRIRSSTVMSPAIKASNSSKTKRSIGWILLSSFV
jgi:hypothetical protein